MLARRTLLKTAMGAATTGLTVAAPLSWALACLPVRRIAFDNLHTGEKLDIAYWEKGAYSAEALAAVNHVLRDFRTGDEFPIAPNLLDLLVALSARTELAPRYAVISGYRSPATNAMLHARSEQVASGSLHTKGMAIDMRLADLDLDRLRDAAQSLSLGGVGYYPVSDFVHVDVGRVRHWDGA